MSRGRGGPGRQRADGPMIPGRAGGRGGLAKGKERGRAVESGRIAALSTNDRRTGAIPRVAATTGRLSWSGREVPRAQRLGHEGEAR